jgi:hypothetical protein
MSLSTVISLAILLVAASLGACVGSLRASARYYFLAQLTWTRTMVLTLVMVAITLGLWFGGLQFGDWLSRTLVDTSQPGADPWLVELAVRMVLMGLSFAVPWLCIKWWLAASWAHSGQVALLTLVLAVVANTALFVIVRRGLIDSFQVLQANMAPTICGRTAHFRCENCGHDFRVACVNHHPPPDALPITCPNCGQATTGAKRTGLDDADRFMVSKVDSPRRWDLMVFQVPGEPGGHLSRLVGLPNEQLEVFAGDLFINGKRLQKTPGRQEDLWLPVHDTRLEPHAADSHGPHWRPAERSPGWALREGHWHFDAPGDRAVRLDFLGEIVDQISYNQGIPLREGELRIPVGDVQLELSLDQFSGEGNLALSWQFAGRRVLARISARGEVLLENLGPTVSKEGTAQPKREQGVLLRGLGKGSRIKLSVRDGLAYASDGDRPMVFLNIAPVDLRTAKENSAIPAESAPRSSTPAALGAIVQAAPPLSSCQVAITAQGCRGTLSRIVLSRDVYYRTVEETPATLRAAWRGRPTAVFQLGPTGYCALGDNSSRSNDSRFFGEVPRNNVLGVVRWIYWPISRWRELK